MRIYFWDQYVWSSYYTASEFPRVYDPQTGILSGQKCFKIHRVFDPHTAYKIFKTFLKNSVLWPTNCAYRVVPGRKCFKLQREFDPRTAQNPQNIFEDFRTKMQFRRSRRWSPKRFQNGSVATSVATFIPSYMCKILIKKWWIRRECYFVKSACARTPLQKGHGRPVFCRDNYRFRRCNFDT